PGILSAGRSEEHCASTPGCQASYYALESQGLGGTVRVIVLDNSGDVGPTQREWLAAELRTAAGLMQPAIVVGEADLAAQIRAGDGAAIATAQILAQPGASASAYFYDAPEENAAKILQVGREAIPTFGSGTLG